MKKREMILLSILVVSLITVSLYQTLATDIIMNKTNSTDADLSYTFDITDQTGRVVNVKTGATKVLDIFVTNSNSGTIKYGIAYTPSSVKTNDITIAQLNTSKDSVSGLINKGERKQITLVIINNSTSDINLSLVAVTGYEHGGDLIVPKNHTLITENYEIDEPAGAEYIESLLASNPETMNNDDPDGNVRYMGADPNNYVKFNNELWRIIGVFNVTTINPESMKSLKIIRKDSIGSYSWDNKMMGDGSSETNYGSNNWSDSKLMEVLNNGAYWNRTFGECPTGENGTYESCNFSTTGLTEEAKELIEEVYWNTGGISYSNMSNALIDEFYQYERGWEVYYYHKANWFGKVGLMYPSDYGYATNGKTGTGEECANIPLTNWSGSRYSGCWEENYLYDYEGSYQWTLTPLSDSPSDVIYLASYVEGDRYAAVTFSVRPVVYLKAGVKITDGDGSKSNPYILSIN